MNLILQKLLIMNQTICHYVVPSSFHLPPFSIIFFLSRSSHQRCSVKKVLLEISQNLQENTCAGVSFLMNRPTTLIKKRLWHRFLPVNFAKFLKTPFYRKPLDNCFCLSVSHHGNMTLADGKCNFTCLTLQCLVAIFTQIGHTAAGSCKFI